MTNCRNLHAQVMLLINKEGLQQYLKQQNSQPLSLNPYVSSMIEKGKTMSNVGEHILRMVPVIICKPDKIIPEEVKDK